MKFDKQRIFNKVVRHLLKQGAPAVKNCACVYRTDPKRPERGRACGIGGLIPNDRYSPELEGRGASDPDVRAAIGLPSEVACGEDNFLSALQYHLHDAIGIRFGERVAPREFKARLPQAVRDVAARFDLKVPKEVPHV